MTICPDALAATLSRHSDLSNDRSQTLAVLILGLLTARTVNLSHLAIGFGGKAKLSSNYRRLQRFFQHVRLDADWLALTLVALLKFAPPYRLCLDRTNWKVGAKDVNLLVLCIVTKRARLPVLWTVLDHSGSSDGRQRQALLERFIALFGQGSIKFLLADREFVGGQWIDFLIENDIPFAIRVRAGLHVRLIDGFEGPLERLTANNWARARLMRTPGSFATMRESRDDALRFVALRRADGTMIVVATNRDPAKALRAYKGRWQIECLFADAKTRGFNMEDTRLTQSPKLALLLAVVALAMAWSIACATVIKGRADIPRASHGYRRKSWFRTGFDMLRFWIGYHPAKATKLWRAIWNRRIATTNNPIRVV